MIDYTKEIQINIDIAIGYKYFIDKDHPLATGNSGRVYLHRHIASIKLGRWILSEEHVHHIDENKLNNSPDNLVVLTAEEHGKLHQNVEKLEKICPICDDTFYVVPSHHDRVTCSVECAALKCTKVHIDKIELEKLIWNYPYTVVGKMLGLSDNGVRKKAKYYGCKIPPPMFHNKSKAYKDEQRKLNNII